MQTSTWQHTTLQMTNGSSSPAPPLAQPEPAALAKRVNPLEETGLGLAGPLAIN